MAARVQCWMRDELRRLQGGHVGQQDNRWRLGVRQRIGGGAAAGSQDGGFQLPKPRPKAVAVVF